MKSVSVSVLNVSTAVPMDIVLAIAPSHVAMSSLVVTAGKLASDTFKSILLTVASSTEHKAAECPNPRSAEGVECKRCNESI